MAYIKQNITEDTDMTPDVFEHMETGIKDAHDLLDAHKADSMFKTTGGTANAQTITLSNNFDFTKDGNMLFINPSFTNTGAMTINPNAQGAKAIKKFNIDTNAYVDLEAGDIKKNHQTDLRWDLANGFFVLAPKGGGSNIKSIQRGTFTITATTQNITISSIDPTKSILKLSFEPNDSGADATVSGKITSATNVEFKTKTVGSQVVSWEVIEFNNVKSLQTGSITGVNTRDGYTISVSSVNTTKSILFFNCRLNGTGTGYLGYACRGEIVSDTSISFTSESTSTNFVIEWLLIEFI